MNKLCKAALAMVATGWIQAASAQAMPTNGYLSVSAGPSHISVDCAGTSSCDDKGTAVRLLIGYKVLPNLAIEASVADLGKVKATVPFDDGAIDASIKGRAFGLGVAALLPFGAHNEWTGIARLGVASVRTTVSATSGGTSADDSDTKTAAYAGLGLNYAFTQNLELGVAVDSTRINDSGDKATARSYNVVGTFKF